MKGILSRMFAVAAMALLLVGSFGVNPANAVVSNTLIKGSSPAVYWYANNGKRYVFPNVKTFYSWFTANDFGRVQVISDYELSQIPLGGNVTYRGGAKLLKVTTDPRVYAVSRYGTLRWVTSEYLAAQLYGANWRLQVEDVPDAYFVNYTLGSPIYSASDFSASNEYNGVNSPTDNIQNLWSNPVNNVNPSYPYPPYPSGYPNYSYPYYNNSYTYNDGFTSSSYVSGSITNRWMSGDQEAITYTATVYNRNTAMSNIFIRIMDEYTNTELGRCSGTETCSITLASRDTKNVNIYARANDQRGNAIETSRLSATYGRSNWYNNPYNPGYYNNQTTFTGSARLTASRTEGVIANGSDSITLTAYIDTVSTDIRNVSVKIYRVGDDAEVGSCTGSWSCTSRAVTFTNYGNRHTSEQFYAIVKDQFGRTLSRIYSPLITLLDDTPYYPPISFQVTSASVSVSPSYNTCGTDSFTFTGTITTNAAGTVRYNWERSDGGWTPEETIYFGSAGTQTVTNTWSLNSDYSGWQRLRILAPNDTSSNMATFSHASNCLWYY